MKFNSRKMVFFRLAFILIPLLYPYYHWSQQTNKGRLIFEQGKVSSHNVEYGNAFSSDGTELYFVRSEDSWGSSSMHSTIYYSRKVDSLWTEPEVSFFSGTYDDSDPHLTKDGNRLYFISIREQEQFISHDIWIIKKKSDGSWGIPERLPEPINSDFREYSPKTDSFGNLYFASDRPGGYGQGDLYICRFENGNYLAPENLGSPINLESGEWNLDISQSGNILLFEASGRKENKSPYGDLYICFKRNNSWSMPQNIVELNTTGSDLYPQLMFKESVLFYSSSNSLQAKNTNIYQIHFSDLIESYRKKAFYPNNGR